MTISCRSRAVALLFVAIISTALIAKAHAQANGLEVLVSPDREAYRMDEEIFLNITVKNTSSAPLVLPSLTAQNAPAYLYPSIRHLETGLEAFFVQGFDQPSGQVAANTMVLQPGQQAVFRRSMNPGAYGPLAYLKPSEPNSLELLTGRFEIRVKLLVNSENRPEAGDAALIRGEFLSSPALVEIRGATEVPTMSSLGLVALFAILAACGVILLRKWM